jgi:hypothetical protein
MLSKMYVHLCITRLPFSENCVLQISHSSYCHQRGSSRRNTPDLYFGGAWFKSRRGHWLSWLQFFSGFPQSLQAGTRIKVQLLPSGYFPFIIRLSSSWYHTDSMQELSLNNPPIRNMIITNTNRCILCFWILSIVHNIQKHIICINVPSSQTLELIIANVFPTTVDWNIILQHFPYTFRVWL